MKYSAISRIILTCLAGLVIFSACKKKLAEGNGPVITNVRNYAASPNDTILHSIADSGQTSWVVIVGQNLQNAVSITFDGVPASINNALFAPGSAVVQLPSILFSSVTSNQLSTIQYATTAGTTSFSFTLLPPAPTISAISNVFATSGDSVYIYGTNFNFVQSFTYGGANVTSFNTNTSATAVGFVMPSPAVDSGQAVITTKSGTATFTIQATPTITSVSNENPSPGDSVYLYGTYLLHIQSLSFAGTSIPSFASNASGTSVGFVAPTLTQSGPASVTTIFGTASTFYKVNDLTDGIISDFEWSGTMNWQYWGGANLSSGNSSFPGNATQYLTLQTSILGVGEGNNYSSYALRMNANQWVPNSHLGDSTGNWALKFECDVPQAWNGGTFTIQGPNTAYTAYFQPWQVSSTVTAPFTTDGWTTVTIPLSAFSTATAPPPGGSGSPVPTLTDLVVSSLSGDLIIWIENYSSNPTSTGFYGAFDNFRVVQIK
jgi:hypothetical protein